MSDNKQQQSYSGDNSTYEEVDGQARPSTDVATWNGQVIPGSEEIDPMDIVPFSALHALVFPARDNSGMAIHDQMIAGYTIEEREMIADAYEGREPRPFGAYAGRVLKVYGGMLREQPGGWKDKGGRFHKEGYFQVRLLVEDPDLVGSPLVVVKSSGVGLAKHLFHILNARGWFFFDEPIEYRFEVGSDNSHRILNVSHSDLKARISALHRTSKEGE